MPFTDPFIVGDTRNPGNNTKSQFSIYNPTMADNYNSVVNDMLSGKMYDPMRAANQEALVRTEAQQRANTANQINRFGAVGQGIGSQIANATESNIRKNRFDSSIQADIAENDMRRQGLQEVRNTIGAERDLLGIERDRFNLQYESEEKAGKDFAAYAQTHLDLRDVDPGTIATDQALMNYGQRLWEARGGKGEVSPQWIKGELDALYDPRLNNEIAMQLDQFDQLIKSGVVSQEDRDVSNF